MKNDFRYWLLAMFLVVTGCAKLETAAEPLKVIWGSSTRALQNARRDAIKKNFQCTPDECFAAVLKLTEPPPKPKYEDPEKVKKEAPQPLLSVGFGKKEEEVKVEGEDPAIEDDQPKRNYLELFIKDTDQRFLVVMGIPGCVNTTEVGIFVTSLEQGAGIEISSLSTIAKIKAAEIVFEELQKSFLPQGE